VDDLIDTGGTIVAAVKRLEKKGAREIYATCTHAVFSGSAVEDLEKSNIREIVVTDTLPSRRKSKKIRVLSVAGLLGDAIKRIHKEKSVSILIRNRPGPR